MGSDTIRLNAKIVKAIRSRKRDRTLGDGTIMGVASEAIRLFFGKHEQCFKCDDHRGILTGIEVARQMVAASGREPEVEWVGLRKPDLDAAKGYARAYGTMRNVVEQAIMEHLTRTSKCDACPCYGEMCSKANVRNRRS
jgi:hypothetical protein